MSKMFRVIWIGLILLLVLAACAPAPTAAPTSAPPTAAPKSSASSSSAASSSAPAAAAVTGTITIWNGYHTGDNEEKTLNQLLDAAKKAYPDAKINVLEIPFDQLFNKFETEAATGGGPDMYIAPNDSLGKEARAGLLAPLDDMLKGKLDPFSKLSVQGVTVDGKIYAVPMIPKALAMYYNKSTVTTPPATTDDLLALVKSGKKVGIPNSGYHTFGWWRAFGGALMDDKGKCIADTTGVADAYKFLMDLKAAGANITDDGKLDTLYRQGQLDVYFNGPWVLGGNEDALGKDKVGVAPMPKGSKGEAGPLTGIDGWYINANSKNKTSAVNLALFFASKDSQTAYANIAGDPAARTDITPSDPNVKAFADAANVGVPRPLVPQLDNFWGPFGDAATKIFEGKSQPADAIKEACDAMNKANKITASPASSSSSSAVASSSASSVASSAASSSAAPATAKKLVIGFTESKTGAQQVASQKQSQGLNLWLDDVKKAGGIKLKDGTVYMPELKSYDDQSAADRVQQLYTQLINTDKVDFLISPYSSTLVKSAAIVSEQNGKVMITAGGADDATMEQGFKNIYQLYTPGSQYLIGAVDMMLKLDPTIKKVAVAYEKDSFSTSVVKGTDTAPALLAYLKDKGLDAVVNEAYDTGTTDFAPIINKIQASTPDVILGGGHLVDGTSFAKQLKDKNIPVRFVALLVAPPEPTFADIGDAALAIVGPSQWETQVTYSADAAKAANLPYYGPSAKDFTAAYTAKFNSPPSYHSAGGYATGLILQKALEDAGSIDPAAVKAALDKMNLMTFYGVVKFSTDAKSHGKQAAHTMVYMQWQKDASGKLVPQIVWPLSAKSADGILRK